MKLDPQKTALLTLDLQKRSLRSCARFRTRDDRGRETDDLVIYKQRVGAFSAQARVAATDEFIAAQKR